MVDAKQSQPNLQASVYTTQSANGSNLIADQQNQHGPLVPARSVSNCTADSLTTNDPSNVTGAENNVSDANSTNNEQVMIDKETEEYFKSFPPGYRFCPSDSELIVHYLNKKIKNEKLPRHRIQELNLYKYSPDKVTEMYQVLGVKEWYFFTPRDRKYSNGTRPNRAAGSGYWKATGADKAIRSNGSTIGFRKALVFYEGKPPKGDKTNWIMHEYRVNAQPRKKSCANDMRLDDYVLCRIYKKTDKSFKSRLRNGDERSDCLYLNSPTDQNVQAASDSHYEKDEHMDDYTDYPQPVLPNGVLEIPQLHGEVAEVPHLQCEASDLSSTEDITKYAGNFFQSSDYGLGQTPVCFWPPTESMWNSKPKITPMPPVYSTNNDFKIDYLKEGAWDFKGKGLYQEYFLLGSDFGVHDIGFVDPEVCLDSILDNNRLSSPPDSPSIPKREED